MSDDFEHQYLGLLSSVLHGGQARGDRTGTGTKSVFHPEPIVVDPEYGFPLLRTKFVPFKSVLAETLWFTQGRHDLESLRADGCTWWDEWEREDGTLGRVYGAQLRGWVNQYGETHDQLAWVINEIKTNPESRRLVATMWNAGELDDMALPPCHGAMIQFYVDQTYPLPRLDLMVYIRSSDLFLGLPTNIPSYALVQRMVAQVTGLKLGTLTVQLGDAHIYSNHMKQAKVLLDRWPDHLPSAPHLEMDPKVKNIDDFKMSHFTLKGYQHMGKIPAPVAV